MKRRFQLPASIRISLVYVSVAGLWILLSDYLIGTLFKDPLLLTRFQTYKGWIFVLVTGGLLLLILSREFNTRWRIEEDLKTHRMKLEQLVEQRTEELQIANQQLKQKFRERETMGYALRESEERYRRLVELSPDAILVHCGYKLVYVNAAAVELLGAEEEGELLGKSPLGFLLPEYRRLAEDRIKKSLAGEYIPTTVYKVLSLKGEIKDTEICSLPFRYRGKPAVQVIARDITARKRLDEEDLKASKLEAIGFLAGGIAHDFNNLLTVILGNVSLAKARVDNNVKLTERLEETEKAANQAKGLTQQLLTFAKGGSPVKTVATLGDLVKNAVDLVLSGTNVQSNFRISDDLWPVEVDIGQINQVINNLVINAVQAMPRGGILEVEIINCSFDSTDPMPLKEGDYVRLLVADHGEGIPEENISKIFDPYFTTKQNGSGLGLATTYSIIKKHGGYIFVESLVGEGTCFNVYLPAVKSALRTQKEKKNNLKVGSGRVLLMDDEASLRQTVGEMLQHLGYQISYARDGAETVKLYKTAKDKKQPFDAVIMDLTIPGGMGGKEAVQEIKQFDPNVTAIVSSGYSNDPVIANYADYGFIARVSKPYEIEELSKVVYEAVNT